MNTNRYKFLFFCLLSFLLGWAVSHFCCRGGCHKGGCDQGRTECHQQGMCAHGGDCCKPDGKCDKEGCDHKMGGDCCKGHGAMKGDCCKKGGMPGEDKVHVIIDGLKEKNFQGDTTITIDGGTVHISRHGEDTQVKVEMRDSVKVDASVSGATEKTVEVHTH